MNNNAPANLLELTAQAYYDLEEDEQADVRENVEMVPIVVKLVIKYDSLDEEFLVTVYDAEQLPPPTR